MRCLQQQTQIWMEAKGAVVGAVWIRFWKGGTATGQRNDGFWMGAPVAGWEQTSGWFGSSFRQRNAVSTTANAYRIIIIIIIITSLTNQYIN